MFSTYHNDDVVLLLKDITGMVEPKPMYIREKLIQSGTHYSEMLPLEYKPSEMYLATFQCALNRYSYITANAVAVVAEQIFAKKGASAVIVSLARAGTPIGILIKRYLKKKYGISVAHYTISIIRGRGIDRNAMEYILRHHRRSNVQFVDGWTGKGAIQNQLIVAMKDYPEVDPGLAVLSDPAYIAKICGTHDDFLIASSCLNSTVSGLLSRTVLRNDIIGPSDYHGAVFYSELLDQDRTYSFIDSIQATFPMAPVCDSEPVSSFEGSHNEVRKVCEDFCIKDINLVKPSIGEATRVLLRRFPWKILVHSLNDETHLAHLYQLAEEKDIELVEYPLKHYRACGLIKEMSDA